MLKWVLFRIGDAAGDLGADLGASLASSRGQEFLAFLEHEVPRALTGALVTPSETWQLAPVSCGWRSRR